MCVSVRERKWREIWEIGEPLSKSGSKGKLYVLSMFPYPSGKIHMGHVRNYTIGDVLSRLKSAQGYKVLQPMGWDAFGLPAENAARSQGINPAEWIKNNIKDMKKTMKSMGLAVDWSREIATCDPSYYKHQQEIFLILLRNGLAYRKKEWVNWDPVDKTTLANEQVINGKGWRSGAVVERRKMKQWFLRIKNFTEDLLNQELPNWPASVKKMQENWIGKSGGLSFDLQSNNRSKIRIYSTRPETIFGATFIGLSLEHPLILEEAEKNPALKEFIETQQTMLSTYEETKTGFKLTATATHPFTKEQLPIYATAFVMMNYGTGAVYGCPAHDKRDFDFAKMHSIEIKHVIEASALPYLEAAGKMINSDFLNNMEVEEARETAVSQLMNKCNGKRETTYKLRDWGVSRQRAWGCPIPVIYCDKCGLVEAKNLPVTLPEDLDYGETGNPLENHPWSSVRCPKCGCHAKRETDTLDTFFDSSWYFLRFCSPSDHEQAINKDGLKWLPVDYYIGGKEHAILHLLYARFLTKVLYKEGIIGIQEPFVMLFTQGMVCHATFKDKDGKWLYPDQVTLKDGIYYKGNEKVQVGPPEAMSKSKKNIISAVSILEQFGADATRWFILSDTSQERDMEWSERGIQAAAKFLRRINTKAVSLHKNPPQGKFCEELEKTRNLAIINATKFFSTFQMNRALAEIHKLYNAIEKSRASNVNAAFETLVKLMYPVTPHMAEEMWSLTSRQPLFQSEFWEKGRPPQENKVHIAVQVNGKLRDLMIVGKEMQEKEMEKMALSLDKVKKHIQNKEVKKIIVVKEKVVNVIVD